MAGHNKWSKVKHIKAKEDAKKGKIFAKCVREIALAVKAGGADPDSNARLRSCIDNARAVSMPKENIERAIKKGSGEGGGGQIQEVCYEGYGPQASAFMVEIATDNINRSAAEIRTLFAKNNGQIATPGSVAYQFTRKGVISFKSELEEERLFEIVLEAGAEELQQEDGAWLVHTAASDLAAVSLALQAADISVEESSLQLIANTPMLVDDMQLAGELVKLYEALDDYDDTMNVYTNFDFSAELIAALDA